MNPIALIHTLLTAKRRAAENHAAFITVIRQIAALLAAGRALPLLWPELAAAHPPCESVPAPEDPNPKCCMHHVLARQHIAALVAEPYFRHITAPSASDGWQQLSATLTLAQDTGMPLATILERLADALEAGQDAQQARAAASAGPKATASLLAWLPVAGLGLAHLLGASLFELLTTPTGWLLLVSGAGLALAGRSWTRRMIRTAQEP